MIEWFTWVQVIVAVIVGVFCLAAGITGRLPDDFTLGATLLVEVLLLGQFVVAILAPLFGNTTRGSTLEFYIYLISAVLIPPAAVFWGLIERNRWSTVILGVASMSVAIMVYRMYQIWNVQVA